VPASIIATCCPVSFSYVVSGEPTAIVRPIAATAPDEAASRLTLLTAVADRPGDEVNSVPDGRVTGHHTPAATTPSMCRAIASALAGNPMAGLVPGVETSLAGPLSCTVTVVASRTVNARETWPAAVAVSPSTATKAPTPRIVPSMVSPARRPARRSAGRAPERRPGFLPCLPAPISRRQPFILHAYVLSGRPDPFPGPGHRPPPATTHATAALHRADDNAPVRG